MPLGSWIGSLTERLLVALVSGVAAALTLFLFPVALALLGGGAGGGGELAFGALFYAFVFSKVGLIVVIGAAVVGFCVGSERMASVFSFFWGTHTLWARFGTYLNEKLGEWSVEYVIPRRILLGLLVVLLFVLAIVVWKRSV